MMKLNEADVFGRFLTLAGMDAAEAEPYRALCADAAGEMERGERARCGPEAAGPLAAASAALAFYRLALARAAKSADVFQAGGLRVSPGKADAGPARGLWCQALAAASPYLGDPRFFFRGTRP